MRFLSVLVFVVVGRAQQDPADLLRRVQAQVSDSVEKLPRYMCTETIDRVYYVPESQRGHAPCDEGPALPPTRLSTSDRLRLDVAMGADTEMYSWAGESRFNDRDLMGIVRDGAISNGSFTAFLTAIFRHGDASFTYRGETTAGDRTLAEFDFRVPYEKSHFAYNDGPRRVVTGYEGAFTVDTNSADLVHLVVRTDRLPPQSAACYATTTLNYGRIHLNGADFLLPTESRLRILHTDGGDAQNRTVFSGCHEFHGESTISFGPEPPASPEPPHRATVPKTARIPAGLNFRIRLEQGIDTSKAAAGDSLKASLADALRDGPTEFAPAGAAVTARILRIRWYYGTTWALDLRIVLESVQIGGVSTPLTAYPVPGAGPRGTGSDNRALQVFYRDVHPPFSLGSGLESSWVTAPPQAGNK